MQVELANLKREARQIAKITTRLISEGTPTVTAFVMAGDIASAARVDEQVKGGVPPVKCVWMAGSYARFDWAIKNLSEAELFQILPELWVGSDPDDTKPEYLQLWERAFALKGEAVTDGRKLPDRGRFTIYRGQEGDGYGISWTLDRAIAERFAAGAGMRTRINGRVLTRRVSRTQILAYLTSRGESELIVRP